MVDRPVRRLAPESLREVIETLLRGAGCSAENAAGAADVFLEADLRGIGLQGLDHAFTMLDDLKHGAIDGQGRPELVREGVATALVDGHRGPGQPGAVFATEVAIRKAREAGVAAVGLTNGADIYMIGYYAELMARAGLVGLVFSAAPSLVHAHGGVERRLGTNPLAIAVPTAGAEPVVLDMATSALSGSRIRQAAYHGETVPPGMGVGPDGAPTTAAAAIEKGAIAPLAGHKGFGLSLCVALLAGPLTGGEVGTAIEGWLGPGGRQGRRGHLFVAIDPAAFGEPAAFLAAVSGYITEIKGSRKAPGVDAIRVPGERTLARRAQSLAEGVEVLEATWDIAARYAAELGVALPSESEGGKDG